LNASIPFLDRKALTSLFDLDGYCFLEADKSVGYCLLDNSDILAQYEKINAKQHFVKVDIKEKVYINTTVNFINNIIQVIPAALSPLIPRQLKKPVFDGNYNIGILRLQPKVLKLKSVNKASINELQCRGIRASVNDPLSILEKILHFILTNIYTRMQQLFRTEFGITITPINGSNLFASQCKSNPSPFNAIHFEADITDMYSNCNSSMLKNAIAFSCNICEIFPDTFVFLNSIIDYTMANAFFLEPTGIFKCNDGFPMGSHFLAVACDLILFVAEFNIFSLMLSKVNSLT